jgi:ABC-type antimicrobial peptide transport system permease subunit
MSWLIGYVIGGVVYVFIITTLAHFVYDNPKDQRDTMLGSFALSFVWPLGVALALGSALGYVLRREHLKKHPKP